MRYDAVGQKEGYLRLEQVLQDHERQFLLVKNHKTNGDNYNHPRRFN